MMYKTSHRHCATYDIMAYVTDNEMLNMTDHMRVWHGSRLRLVVGEKMI